MPGCLLAPDLQVPAGPGVRVIPGLLGAGVGAVISASLRSLPLAVTWEPDAGLFWRCTVQVPAGIDPQHPEGILWARRLLDTELPDLLGRAGLPLRPTRPGVIDAVALRKGSWLSLRPSGWLALIGLTGSPWPAAWGGQVSAGLTLLPPGAHLEAAVLQKHAEALLLRCPLEPR